MAKVKKHLIDKPVRDRKAPSDAKALGVILRAGGGLLFLYWSITPRDAYVPILGAPVAAVISGTDL